MSQNVFYRYFFWQWLFCDLQVSDPWQRAAARAHNLRQRIHLPVYLRRWTGLTLFHFLAGCILEPSALMLSVVFFCSFAMSSCVLTTAAVSWVMLR
jgi:hypothetical protein